jgi:hypothetical protein
MQVGLDRGDNAIQNVPMDNRRGQLLRRHRA